MSPEPKFSRPTARVLFSNVAVICPYEGKPHLMVRLANERNNRIVDANVHVVMLRREISKEGHSMRRFYDMGLIRDRVPMMQMSWTLMHPIDENSPLYGAIDQKMADWDAEILVSLVGLDETFSQTIHARCSYIPSDILFNHRFVDVMTRTPDNKALEINYTLFHNVEPVVG
jgi:inward rectifier potassium channel